MMPAAADGLGDQAMLQAIADNLPQMGLRGIRQVLMPSWGAFPLRGPELPALRIGVDDVRKEHPKLLSAIQSSGAVFAIGADVIDGHYGMHAVEYELGILALAARAGRPAVLTGHSVSEHPHPEAIKMLAALSDRVSLNVRDPVSLARFEKFTGRQATLVADLAFLVVPDAESADVAAAKDWTARQRAQGRRILCLNINGLNAEKQSAGLGFIAFWRQFLDAFLTRNPDCSIMFLSHDIRPGSSDAAAHLQLIASLDPSVRAHAYDAPTPETAAAAKAIASLADLVLTGRMHLAIGALSQAVPTYCMAYVGKYEGLAAHLQIDDLIIPADALGEPAAMAKWLGTRLPQLAPRRLHLEAVLPQVKEAARKNFLAVRQSSAPIR